MLTTLPTAITHSAIFQGPHISPPSQAQTSTQPFSACCKTNNNRESIMASIYFPTCKHTLLNPQQSYSTQGLRCCSNTWTARPISRSNTKTGGGPTPNQGSAMASALPIESSINTWSCQKVFVPVCHMPVTSAVVL